MIIERALALYVERGKQMNKWQQQEMKQTDTNYYIYTLLHAIATSYILTYKLLYQSILYWMCNNLNTLVMLVYV